MLAWLKKIWPSWGKNPLERPWDIRVRRIGLNVWVITSVDPADVEPGPGIRLGSVFRVMATEDQIQQFSRAGSCFRSLDRTTLAMLQAGQRIDTTLNELIHLLRD